MARHLLDAGAAPVLVCAKEPDAYRGAALHWLRVAMSLGVPVVPADAWAKGDARAPSAPDIVVDALLGTGFHGKLRERETSFVEKAERPFRALCACRGRAFRAFRPQRPSFSHGRARPRHGHVSGGQARTAAARSAGLHRLSHRAAHRHAARRAGSRSPVLPHLAVHAPPRQGLALHRGTRSFAPA